MYVSGDLIDDIYHFVIVRELVERIYTPRVQDRVECRSEK